MNLPRPAEVRHELSEIGLAYGLVVALVAVGLLLYFIGHATPTTVPPPVIEPMGPTF